MTTNLAFRNWSDPTQGEVDSDGDDADDPEHLGVVLAVVAEDDGEDDTAEVSGCPGAAGNDTVCVGVYVCACMSAVELIKIEVFWEEHTRHQ